MDSVTGDPIIEVTEQGFDNGLTFRLCVEIACPVTLVPNPTKYQGTADVFAGAGFTPTYSQNQSPVQYELLRLGNAF